MAIFTGVISGIAGLMMLAGAYFNAVEKGRFKDDYRRWGYPRRMHVVTAVLEGISGLLLLWPTTRLYGAALGVAIMLAAIATVVWRREYDRVKPPIVYLGLLGAVVVLSLR